MSLTKKEKAYAAAKAAYFPSSEGFAAAFDAALKILGCAKTASGKIKNADIAYSAARAAL